MYIYTITTFEELDNEYGGIAGSSRCVGYYDNCQLPPFIETEACKSLS